MDSAKRAGPTTTGLPFWTWIRAGEAFWEPGGDVIHYSDGNNREDMRCRFTVTMLCVPGRPMLTLVDDDELAARKHLRVPAESGTAESLEKA